jgi:hypothetical protein
MVVHVDELTSEVTPEPEPAPEGAGEAMEWKRVEQTRAALSRALRDDLRTAAEGFDD